MTHLCVTPDQTGLRLDQFLSMAVDNLSRTRLKSLILEGQITREGEVMTDPSMKVREGDLYAVVLPELKEALPEAQAMDLEVLYEDDDLLVINKPAGLVVHPAPGHPDQTLVNALLAHCGDSLSGISGVKRPGIVHRLDKETSGLMVVAKNDAAHQGLSAQFSDRTLSRQYYALVWGLVHPVHGTIEGNLGRHPRNRQKMSILAEGGKEAITHYNLMTAFLNFASLVECSLETGRTHQIRVHLAAKGYGVVGDNLYGKPPRLDRQKAVMARAYEAGWPRERHALHAYHLEFIHPTTGETMVFEVPMASDMDMMLDIMKEVFFA